MKKLLILSLGITALFLAGCQDAPAAPSETATATTSKADETAKENTPETTTESTVESDTEKKAELGLAETKMGLIQGEENPKPVVAEKTDTSMAAVTVIKKITITKDGFTPKELTIKAGTTVIFTNDDDKKHWPASDPHPVHTLEPAFDAKKALATGESFEYTFTKAGTYPFHDHAAPSFKGTITVTE